MSRPGRMPAMSSEAIETSASVPTMMTIMLGGMIGASIAPASRVPVDRRRSYPRCSMTGRRDRPNMAATAMPESRKHPKDGREQNGQHVLATADAADKLVYRVQHDFHGAGPKQYFAQENEQWHRRQRTGTGGLEQAVGKHAEARVAQVRRIPLSIRIRNARNIGAPVKNRMTRMARPPDRVTHHSITNTYCVGSSAT